MNIDSVDQFEQARRFAFSDWHPPIMALLWHFLDLLIAGPAGLFALNIGLYWSGFWLLAIVFARSRPSLSYLTLLAAFAPVLATIPAMLWKDSLVFSCFLSASALLVASSSCAGLRRAILVAPALLLLLIGALARHNAMLAAGPLLMLGIRPAALRASGARAAMIRLGVLTLATVAATSLAGWLLNRHVLDVRPSGVANSLMAFDIVGIAARTGANGLPGPWSGDEQHRIITDCYEPWAWDSLAWGRCAFVKERLVASGDWQRGLVDPWLAAISDRPAAYMRHRLAYTRTLFRRVPALLPQPEPISSAYGFTANAGFRAITQLLATISNAPIVGDFWRAGLWIAFAAVTCIVASLRGHRHLLSRQAGYLSLSGLFYALPLVIVGVASEFRYVYWTIGAVLVATLMLASDGFSELVKRRAGAPAGLPRSLPAPTEPRGA